jgi:hypothetical protein
MKFINYDKITNENYGQHTGYSDSCNGYPDSKYQHLRPRPLHSPLEKVECWKNYAKYFKERTVSFDN